jgi:hypothetical protein
LLQLFSLLVGSLVLLGAFGLLAPGTLELVICDVGVLAPFGFEGFAAAPLGLKVPVPPDEFAPPSPPNDLI